MAKAWKATDWNEERGRCNILKYILAQGNDTLFKTEPNHKRCQIIKAGKNTNPMNLWKFPFRISGFCCCLSAHCLLLATYTRISNFYLKLLITSDAGLCCNLTGKQRSWLSTDAALIHLSVPRFIFPSHVAPSIQAPSWDTLIPLHEAIHPFPAEDRGLRFTGAKPNPSCLTLCKLYSLHNSFNICIFQNLRKDYPGTVLCSLTVLVHLDKELKDKIEPPPPLPPHTILASRPDSLEYFWSSQ